tara:strand:+ start:32 stop:265 length:234 start_codon:yes stop_codon:yes gene_type:complete
LSIQGKDTPTITHPYNIFSAESAVTWQFLQQLLGSFLEQSCSQFLQLKKITIKKTGKKNFTKTYLLSFALAVTRDSY